MQIVTVIRGGGRDYGLGFFVCREGFDTSGHEVPGHPENGGEDGDACDDVLLLSTVQDVVYPGAEPRASATGTAGLASHHRRRRRRLYSVGSWCVRLRDGLRLRVVFSGFLFFFLFCPFNLPSIRASPTDALNMARGKNCEFSVHRAKKQRSNRRGIITRGKKGPAR